MRTPRTWFLELDAEWRAVVVGTAGAPTLAVVAFLAAWVEGGLLPGDCQGLACVFTLLVLVYSGLLLAGWGVVAGLTALTRRAGTGSTLRTWILRVLAVVSYLPAVWVLLELVTT